MLNTGKFVIVDNGTIDDTGATLPVIIEECGIFNSAAEAATYLDRDRAKDGSLRWSGCYHNGYLSIVEVRISAWYGEYGCYACGCTEGDSEDRCPYCGRGGLPVERASVVALNELPSPDLVGEQEARDQQAEDDDVAATFRRYRMALDAKSKGKSVMGMALDGE